MRRRSKAPARSGWRPPTAQPGTGRHARIAIRGCTPEPRASTFEPTRRTSTYSTAEMRTSGPSSSSSASRSGSRPRTPERRLRGVNTGAMPTTYDPAAPAALAVDVGGSHVKVLVNGAQERRRFASGRKLTAEQMVAGVLELTGDWAYAAVTVGVPAPVHAGRVVHEPVNLGRGWVGYDFESAFRKPTKVINDAAMQALGSYDGGRM